MGLLGGSTGGLGTGREVTGAGRTAAAVADGIVAELTNAREVRLEPCIVCDDGTAP